MAARKKGTGIAAMIEVVAKDNYDRGHEAGHETGYAEGCEAGWEACEQDMLAQLEQLLNKGHNTKRKSNSTRKATKQSKPRRARRATKKATTKPKPGRRHIANLGMSDSTTNKLHKAGLTTVNQVVKYHRDEPKGLRSLGRFGTTSVDEVREAFSAIKVKLDGTE